MDINQFLNQMIARDPDQREFHQAVEEVVTTLAPLLKKPGLSKGKDIGAFGGAGACHHVPRTLDGRPG